MSTSDKRLTSRQRDILNFVRDRILNRGYGPTVREIGVEFEIRSPNGVMCHLKALEKKGLITRESYMSRAIKLTGAPMHTQNLAFLGTAGSGEPFVEARPSDDAVDFLRLLTGDDKVTIRVRGSGYKTLRIDDGDHLIIGRHSCLTTESLVATLDDQNHMILCRVPRDGGDPVPAIRNRSNAPIRQILGVVVAVIRTLDEKPMSTDVKGT